MTEQDKERLVTMTQELRVCHTRIQELERRLKALSEGQADRLIMPKSLLGEAVGV